MTLHKRIGPHGEWTAEMTWHDDDRHGPTGLVVRPTNPNNRPPGGLSQTVLREVNFAAATEEMRETESVAAKVPQIDWNVIGDELSELAQRGPSDDYYLARLSQVYCAAHTPKPLEYLATLTGKSTAAIKSHLWHATRNGLLERTPGRAGGRLTAKTMEILTSH